MRLGMMALGLIAVAIAAPVMIIASLAVDTALHVLDAVKAFSQRDLEKGFSHLGICAINILTLGAVAAGSWQVMVAASVTSALFLTAIGLKTACEVEDKKRSVWDMIDSMSMLGLALTSLVGGINAAQLNRREIVATNYTVRNKNPYWIPVFDRQNRLVVNVGPGQTQSFSLPGNTGSLHTSSGRIGSFNFSYKTTVIQQPIPAHQLPTLPVGSLSLTYQSHRAA
jgi:hypothetical protein